MSDVIGFWSYVHNDDEADHGRIVGLAKKIMAEFELLTGEPLELFIDRDSIEWGVEWRKRIDSTLSSTTFFIPIVTQRYLKSVECRRELVNFLGNAKSLGLEKLLLPILYAEVPSILDDQESADEVVAIIKATQFEDWRDLRLSDESSENYRRRVNTLAARLAEIHAQISEATIKQPIAVPGIESESAEDAPGLIEALAEGEEALPRLQRTMEQFTPLSERIRDIIENGVQKFQESDARGAGFRGRLVVGRQIADELTGPADKMAELGSAYAADLMQLDSMMLAIIRSFGEDPSQFSEAEEFILVVHTFAEQMSSLAASAAEAMENMEGTAKLSRDLRRPIRRIQEGFRSILDAQAVIDEWKRRLDSLEGHGSKE